MPPVSPAASEDPLQESAILGVLRLGTGGEQDLKSLERRDLH